MAEKWKNLTFCDQKTDPGLQTGNRTPHIIWFLSKPFPLVSLRNLATPIHLSEEGEHMGSSLSADSLADLLEYRSQTSDESQKRWAS